MFKTIVTLIRGEALAAEEHLKDRQALALLDQQMRDAAAITERARRALAIAIAQEAQEARRLEEMTAQIVDLETRGVAALEGGREDLATRAAESIAALEADVAAARRAQGLFATQIEKLRGQTRKQTARLAELERGRRVVRAAQATRDARRGCGLEPNPCRENSIAEAEATLARLREKQCECEAADEAFEAITVEQEGKNVAETLASEGFGPATTPRAADVLARLRETTKPAQPVQ